MGNSFDLGTMLARLVQTPRVQFAGKQLVGTAQRQLGQPFQGSARGPVRSKQTGSSAKTSGGIGDLIGQTVGALGRGQQQEDPMMALYNQLIEQLRSPVDGPSGIDKADLMNQVKKALNPIYDQRASAAQSRTDRGTEEVQGMYGALAKDYERLAPEQMAQAAQAQKEVEELYGQLRSNIQGDYSRVSKEQGDLFKSLGIEAALPDVLAEQAEPVQESLVAANENQAQNSQRYMDMGQIDSTYMREGSPIAKMTGNEISVDMIAELQQQLAQIEAERSSGIQSGYMDQLTGAQTQLAQQQQSAQSESARRQEMLFSMLQSSMKGGQQQDLTADSFMGSLPQNTQQSVAGAFTQLQRSPEAVYGKVEDKRNPVPGSFVETTPEWYMAQADKMLQEGSIDAATHQALLMYLQLNFDK